MASHEYYPERAARHRASMPVGRRLGDQLGGLSVGIASLFVYGLTLHPGLIASGDSPELQYIGRVLGTAHNPGYPLYVLVSHVFGWIPVGTLAYRMNLLSAVFGSAAATLLFYVARRLGCGVAAAALVSLGAAWGRVVWAQSVIAEVYSLGVLLLVSTLWSFLRWQDSDDVRWLYGLGVVYGLAVSHQPTALFLLPGLAAYVWLGGRIPRVKHILCWGLVVGLVVAGTYLFVLVRTLQGSEYVESQARTPIELFRTWSASNYENKVFNLRLASLQRRILRIGGVVVQELGLVAIAFVAVGIARLARSDRRALALLAWGALASWAFGVVYVVPDVEVFVIPAFVLLWLLAGVGVGALEGCGAAGRVGIGALALAVPSAQLACNFSANDRHLETADARFFDALMAQLPPSTAVVPLAWPIEYALTYKIAGEGVRPDIRVLRTLGPTRRHWITEGLRQDAQRPLFALGDPLPKLGPGYEVSVVPVFADSLDEFVARRRDAETVLMVGRGPWKPVARRRLEGALRALGANPALVGEPGFALVRDAQGLTTVRAGDDVDWVAAVGAIPGGARLRTTTDSLLLDVGARRLVGASPGILLATVSAQRSARQYLVSADLAVSVGERGRQRLYHVARVNKR